MVQINFAQKQVSAKIVYYGPGMSGKTTNLEVVHQRAPENNKGELTSISTDGDRTLFFDFMPLDLGTVAGMRTSFQIYTVPGQVYYNSTRKLVLQGVDGVVFVADSSAAMLQENLESLRNLEENLNEYGKSLATIAHIIQFNKRDLPDAMSVDELNQHLNPYGAPFFEAIANTGQGVFPTLKALAARVLESIHAGSGPGAVAAPRPQSAPATRGAAAQAMQQRQQPPQQQMAARGVNDHPAAALPQNAPLPLPQIQQPVAFAANAQGHAPALQRTGFHSAQAQPQPAPMMAPPSYTQQQPLQAPAMMSPPNMPTHGLAPAMSEHTPQAQPLSQTGFRAQQPAGFAPTAPTGFQAASQTGFHAQAQSGHSAQAPQGYAQAQQAQPMAAPLNMAAGRVGAPRAQQTPTKPTTQRAPNGPLEGTRFRPRSGAPSALPRAEIRATPAEKPSNKLYVGLFVAAAVILAVGLTYVVMSFF